MSPRDSKVTMNRAGLATAFLIILVGTTMPTFFLDARLPAIVVNVGLIVLYCSIDLESYVGWTFTTKGKQRWLYRSPEIVRASLVGASAFLVSFSILQLAGVL